MKNLFLVAFLFVVGCSSPQTSDKAAEAAGQKNNAWAMGQPYVILISIDGYRYDYTDKFHPPTLESFEKDGASAESLIPIYPSKTFASHYAMITGLNADHSGIAANEFYDPKRKESFAMGSEKNKADGTWYGGHPVWEVVQNSGMLAASYFWVGSDANVNGTHPRYWFPYNDSVDNLKRVDQAIAWLSMPAEDRPHFITLYFSNVDHAGHKTGAASDKVREEVLNVDNVVGELMKRLSGVNLPVNVVIVSDHGMENVNPKPEFVDDMADLSQFIVSAHGPEMKLYLKEGADPKLIDKTKKLIAKKARHFKVYKRSEVPEELHFRDSDRVGDLILVVDAPYLVETHALFKGNPLPGNHGWDAIRFKNLRGIFYAKGPAFKPHVQVPAFHNIDVYAVVTRILQPKPMGPVDATLGSTDALFQAVATTPAAGSR